MKWNMPNELLSRWVLKEKRYLKQINMIQHDTYTTRNVQNAWNKDLTAARGSTEGFPVGAQGYPWSRQN